MLIIVQTSSLYVLLQVALCRRMLGDLEGAAEVYKQGEIIIGTSCQNLTFP